MFQDDTRYQADNKVRPDYSQMKAPLNSRDVHNSAPELKTKGAAKDYLSSGDYNLTVPKTF